jgi:hypothetical protein
MLLWISKTELTFTIINDNYDIYTDEYWSFETTFYKNDTTSSKSSGFLKLVPRERLIVATHM